MQLAALLGYGVRRLLQVIPLVFIVILINFSLVHLAPGDPIDVLTGETGPSEAYRNQIRAEYGLDKPLPVQFLLYVNNVAHLDLGTSIRYQTPVWPLILSRIPATLLLVGTGFLISAVFGVLLGVLASTRPRSGIDRIATVLSLAGQSIPPFWLGILLIIVFGVDLGVLPIQGIVTVREDTTGFARVLDVAWHLVLPALTFSVYQITLVFRLTRSKMREMLLQDFITLARAKGLPERRVVFRHALPNAFLPILTVLAFNFGYILAGATLIETVFAWPGTGRLMYDALSVRDYPLILGLFLVISVTVIGSAFIADIAYALIDPRVSYVRRRA